ncbi:MAG TPA: SCO family protein [Thermodesulfovibrionales bacterium]|nr:SCO family protein [Thermodesulfovibrionales bacterium]
MATPLVKCRVCSFILFFLLSSLVVTSDGVRAETNEKFKRTVENYAVPDVTLVNQNGKKVRLRTLLNSDKPVLVDFIFTTCTTICPVLSIGFCDFQRKLGPESAGVNLVSISIDPDNDTPKAMKAYLQRYDAKPGWDFLTGRREDIEKVLKALDAYTSDKMRHLPLILLHGPAETRWVRIYGIIGTRDLIREYQKVLK